MWIFPTRHRPLRLQRCLDACVSTHMSSRGLIIIDGFERDYEKLQVPPNLNVMATNDHIGFGAVLNLAFKLHPNEPFYGWVPDDCVPRTECWDARLEEACGRWYIGCSNNLLHTVPWWTPGTFGGDLLRSVGYIAPPGFVHLYIDNVWNLINDHLHVYRYLPDVVIEEMHFSNNKAPYDNTYERVVKGVYHYESDKLAFENYVKAHATHQMLDRVAQAMRTHNAITD